MNSYEQLYLLHKKYNNPSQALAYFEKHEHLKDSIFNVENTVRVKALKEQYDNDRNQMKIAALEQEQAIQKLKQRRQNIVTGFLLLGGLLSLTVLYFFTIIVY